jgi:hypothetical protein
MNPALQISWLANFQGTPFIALMILAAMCASENAWCQSNDNQGYISTGVGVARRLNGDMHPHGTQLNALEAGYEFRYGLGIVSSLTFGQFNYHQESYHVTSAYSLITAGPMFVMHLNHRASVDIKARLGYCHFQEAGQSADGFAVISYSLNWKTLGYNITASYQYRAAERWTLFGNLDFNSNTAMFTTDEVTPLSTLGLTLGVGFRF